LTLSPGQEGFVVSTLLRLQDPDYRTGTMCEIGAKLDPDPNGVRHKATHRELERNLLACIPCAAVYWSDLSGAQVLAEADDMLVFQIAATGEVPPISGWPGRRFIPVEAAEAELERRWERRQGRVTRVGGGKRSRLRPETQARLLARVLQLKDQNLSYEEIAARLLHVRSASQFSRWVKAAEKQSP
jgi:hypothetical protein